MSHKDELLYINIPLSGIVGHVCGLKWRTWQAKMYFIFQMYLSIQYFISHLTPKHIFTIKKIIVFCMTFRLPHENALKYCPLYEIISLILFDWFFVGIRATFPYITRNPRQYT